MHHENRTTTETGEPHASQDSEGHVGKPSSELEETDERQAAAALGFDVAEVSEQSATESDSDIDYLLDSLSERDDVSPIVAELLEKVVAENNRLRDRVDDLESEVDQLRDVAKTAVGKAQTNEQEIEDVAADEEETREIAKSAIAKTEQLSADSDHQEDAEQLPDGLEPSTSPLDFFANCREKKVKSLFLEQNRQNTYRAVAVAKRWPEFATKRTDGSGIFWTKDTLERALTAILGESPHRMTVHRVWETLRDDLGSDDVVEKTRQVGRSQAPKDILCMDMETAEELLDERYIHLDLLENSAAKATTGGVTPVVTGESA